MSLLLILISSMVAVALAEPPAPYYSAPPSSSYGEPSHPPSSSYGEPSHPPSKGYGVPSHPPSKGYGAPSYPPSSSYGEPSHPPSKGYGVPSHPPSSSYGEPSHPPSKGYGVPSHPPSKGYGVPSTEYGGHSGHVYKHVYVHSAPEEPVHWENKVIRVPGGHDKHVNVIFVKAPSSSHKQNTEVFLPEQDHQKTLVYVLVKKGESTSDVKLRGPSPTKPAKPEVFFIKYKGHEHHHHDSGYGTPPAVPTYGTPSVHHPKEGY